MNSLIQVINDVKAANRGELINLLERIQNILDAKDKESAMKRAPIAAQVYVEEHENDINSLNEYKQEIMQMIDEEA